MGKYRDAPTTDKEVITIIEQEYHGKETIKSLIGIYEVRREMGDTVQDAWLFTLYSFIKIYDSKQSMYLDA